jgi:acetyl-CoA acetyltransferase
MPLPREDVDATTPKFLRDKYAVVGLGETAYTRGSNMTTRALATIAVRNAMLDAGLKAFEIDGVLSYQSNDSVFSPFVAGDLGIRLNFYMDVFGGGSSTEALIGIAIGVIEAGMCKTVVIFRSMNGFSQVRIGGTGVRAAAPPLRRRAAQPRLRLAERGTVVRADFYAPHVRIWYHRRAGRSCPRCPQPSRLEQS